MRYPGSKRALGKYILPFINEALKVFPRGKYIEPFAGGCNMITQVTHHTKIGYDINEYVIALLKLAQADPDVLRNAECFSKRACQYVKENKELFQPWYVGAVGILPSYGCLWMGTYMNDKEPGRFEKGVRGLLKQDLRGISLICSDYKNIPIGEGNAVYCDPPYRDRDLYKMPFNHDEFYEWVRVISKHNIVLVSEYEMPADFTCVWQMEVTPRINNKSKKRFEKLFIYKGE